MGELFSRVRNDGNDQRDAVQPAMKRLVMSFMVLSLVIGVVATAEAKKKPQRTTRTVEGSYDSPVLGMFGQCAGSHGVGCVSFLVGPKERFVTAKVHDAHGLPVFVFIRSIASGAFGAGSESYGSFCGETTEPIAVPPGTELEFWVGAAASVYGCQPGIATSGTITVMLSNLP